MPSPFIWTMPELSKIDNSVFFSSSSFTCRAPARTHVSSVLLSYNMTTVPIRRVNVREREKEGANDIDRKEKKKEANNRIGFNSPDRYLNRWSKCIFAFSLFLSMSYTRTNDICLFFILFDAKRTMCVNIHVH